MSALHGVVLQRTILGWNRVPAMRVAMAIRSRWPVKTLTWRARETSGRLMVRPLRMRAAVGSSAVTQGNWGRSFRGWTKRASNASDPSTAGPSTPRSLRERHAPVGMTGSGDLGGTGVGMTGSLVGMTEICGITEVGHLIESVGVFEGEFGY